MAVFLKIFYFSDYLVSYKIGRVTNSGKLFGAMVMSMLLLALFRLPAVSNVEQHISVEHDDWWSDYARARRPLAIGNYRYVPSMRYAPIFNKKLVYRMKLFRGKKRASQSER